MLSKKLYRLSVKARTKRPLSTDEHGMPIEEPFVKDPYRKPTLRAFGDRDNLDYEAEDKKR